MPDFALFAIAFHSNFNRFYMWTMAHHFGAHGDLKIILMGTHSLTADVLKWIPVAGQGMLFFEFLFIKRKWHLDKHYLQNRLTQSKKDELPIWLLIYPVTS